LLAEEESFISVIGNGVEENRGILDVKKIPWSSSFADSGSGVTLARGVPRFLLVLVVVALATVAFAALGLGAARLGSSSDLRGEAVCLERRRRVVVVVVVVVVAATSASPSAGCDAAALRAARVVRAGAGSALASALVRRVDTIVVSEIVGNQSMVVAMGWRKRQGQERRGCCSRPR
jgi:hypothetical protein